MLDWLRKLVSQSPQQRSLDAAAGGRRWEGAQTIPNLNSAIFAGGVRTRHRAAYHALNNPVAASAVNAWVANLVGCGIRPRPRHPSDAVRAQLIAAWRAWAPHAEVSGVYDFAGVLTLAVRCMIVEGEVFVRRRPQPPSMGLAAPLQLEVIHPDQVPSDLHRDLPSGGRIRAGIEFDAGGRRVAYHIYRARPGDAVQPRHSLETVRVPAEFVCHLFESLSPGQVRGLSWLTPVLLRLHEFDQLQDAALVKQKVAALFAAVMIDAEGSGSPLDDNVSNGSATPGLEPGTILPLPPGKQIEFSQPPSTADYADFSKALLRSVGAGLGLTYEQLSGDLENVNYSSIRAGLVEFRRRAEQIQHTVIVHQLCRPVWRWFVQSLSISGRFQGENLTDLELADWLPPRWEWVDPQKDVAAEISAIDAKLKSRQQAVAERGRDIEEVDAEIANDNHRGDETDAA